MVQNTEKEAWPRRIYAITLFVEDLAVTKKFYLDAFGLPVVYADANSAVFKIGENLINLLKISEADALIEPAKVASREAGSRFILTIPVEDVDAVCADLSARGVKLLNGPMDRPWGIRTASFMDPAGIIWEVAR